MRTPWVLIRGGARLQERRRRLPSVRQMLLMLVHCLIQKIHRGQCQVGVELICLGKRPIPLVAFVRQMLLMWVHYLIQKIHRARCLAGVGPTCLDRKVLPRHLRNSLERLFIMVLAIRI